MKVKALRKSILYSILLTVAVVIGITFAPMNTFAKTTSEKIAADYYKFESNSKYEITGTNSSKTGEAILGELNIMGEVKALPDVNGVKSYAINSGNVVLDYKIANALVISESHKWHIEKDKSKTVDDLKLEDDILGGALIVQTSLTGDNWITEEVYTNISSSESGFNEQVYTSRDIQQVNGCYYRVIVAYYTEKQIEDKQIAFVKLDNFEKAKRAEVYKFYLINSEDNSAEATKDTAIPRKELGGSKINTGKDNGFSGNEPINDKDPHYGWSIGTFFVNGYTRETTAQNGSPIFLKNVGDRVTLWFGLSQDINCLNGNSNLSINEDKDGSDQYFEISKTNFKHGALIIRYTDYEGKLHDPVIYTDYLAASARTGANTKVELFEEGDYEVALDYEIKNSKGVDSVSDYRIFFTFSIRNGNCMVYPFDSSTGAELADNSITENGFKLDMARSRYLTIDVKKTAVKLDGNAYVEDVRFNRPAKDGEIYNDEGIYIFTVKNLYTGGEPTTKVIYIGTTPVLKALAMGLTLSDINTQIADGAELLDDGTLYKEEIIEEEVVTEEEVNDVEVEEAIANTELVDSVVKEETSDEKKEIGEVSQGEESVDENTTEAVSSNNINPIILGVVALLLICCGVIVVSKKTKANK